MTKGMHNGHAYWIRRRCASCTTTRGKEQAVGERTNTEEMFLNDSLSLQLYCMAESTKNVLKMA